MTIYYKQNNKAGKLHMYRIKIITDKSGVIKSDYMDELRKIHPTMAGEIVNKELLELHICFCFLWNDDSGKMLRTSYVEKYETTDNYFIVYTLNSVYYLSKIQ